MKRKIYIGICILTVITLLAGCSTKAKIDENNIEATEFTDEDGDWIPDDGNYTLQVWDGNWTGIDEYLRDPAMDNTYEYVAKKKKISVKKAKKYISKKYKNEIKSLFLKGNTLVVFSDKYSDGYALAEYEHYRDSKGSDGVVWHIFKLKSEDGNYPYISFSDRYQTESGTHYFILRHGKSLSELNQNIRDDYPIKIQSEISSEDVAMLIMALEK